MPCNHNREIVAVIWLFNPEVKRFAKVLRSIIEQVNKIVLVDNNSSNIKQIRDICEGLRFKDKIVLLELKFNSGVYALNLGMKYACEKFNPKFVLLLDQDTVVYPNAVAKVLAKLNFPYMDKIGALWISGRKTSNEKQTWKIIKRCGIFSGCLINAHLIKQGIKIREDFFLDQADFDFFDKIRSRGFITIAYCGEKLIDHKLGTPSPIHVRLPIIGTTKVYEPAWRYYYIVRNSTILLMEGKLDIKFYISQLIYFAIPLIFCEGVMKFLKALTLAIAHSLSRKLGYLDPKIL